MLDFKDGYRRCLYGVFTYLIDDKQQAGFGAVVKHLFLEIFRTNETEICEMLIKSIFALVHDVAAAIVQPKAVVDLQQ